MHALIFSYREKDLFSKRFHNVESSLRALLRKGIGHEKIECLHFLREEMSAFYNSTCYPFIYWVLEKFLPL